VQPEAQETPPGVTVPPEVYEPFPATPSSVKVLGPVAVIVWHPFAAVFPPTPEMQTRDPVWNRCMRVVPISMGLALLALATENDSPENAYGASFFGTNTREVDTAVTSPFVEPTNSKVVEPVTLIDQSFGFSSVLPLDARTFTSEVNLCAEVMVTVMGVVADTVEFVYCHVAFVLLVVHMLKYALSPIIPEPVARQDSVRAVQ